MIFKLKPKPEPNDIFVKMNEGTGDYNYTLQIDQIYQLKYSFAQSLIDKDMAKKYIHEPKEGLTAVYFPDSISFKTGQSYRAKSVQYLEPEFAQSCIEKGVAVLFAFEE